jgi:hypothetical protein
VFVQFRIKDQQHNYKTVSKGTSFVNQFERKI